jgi:ribosomal protein S18 acetylase RimI-like enzyme
MPMEKTMLQTEVINYYDEQILNDIITINQKSFPSGWDYGDDNTYYGGMLKNKDNISIILKDGIKNVGYLLAIPHNIARKELENDDKFMNENISRYYIESIAIIPEYRNKSGLSAILDTLRRELESRGILGVSLHARVHNNFSKIIQNKIKVSKIRRIDKWKYYNFEEPTDYIEGIF